jgi:hypothetical protein
MRFLLATLLVGCSLYYGATPDEPPTAPYALTLDRAVAAEGHVVGLDADQHGALWLAYDDSTVQLDCATPRLVTLVHWDPTTRTRLATFSYEDEVVQASGLALVGGQLWLNYGTDVQCAPGAIHVIDPSTGVVVRRLAGLPDSWDLAAAADHVLMSTASPVTDSHGVVVALDATSGGVASTFATKMNYGSSASADNWFQQGIASRPGEIWVAAQTATSPTIEIFDESGRDLGVADPGNLQGRDPVLLAFDRGKLLVATGGQLSWFAIAP